MLSYISYLAIKLLNRSEIIDLYSDNEFYELCSTFHKSISESKKIKVKKILLNKSFIKLKQGNTFRLFATIFPRNSSNRKLRWISTAPSICTVRLGTVHARKKGLAYIQALSTDGSKVTSSCTIKIC